MGRLRRFLLLERARPEAPAAPATRVSAGFAAVPVEPVAAPAAAETSPAAPEAPAVELDRFAPPPEASGALDTEELDAARPQLRCLACGDENGRFAATCKSCGNALDGPEVARFNRRLWHDEQTAQRVVRARRQTAQQAELVALTAARRAQIADHAFHRILTEHRAARWPGWLGRLGAWLRRIFRRDPPRGTR